MKYICTDLDNTMLDFAPHFEDWAEKQGHNIIRDVINIDYDLNAMFVDPVDVEEVLQELFHCDITMGSFPALPDTIEPIIRLKEAGYQFVGITACSPRNGLSQIRHNNLTKLFGFDFEEVHVTGFRQPKAVVLERFENAVWVEDNLWHAREGIDLGHKTFLIDYPYNQGDGDFIRVKNWVQIEEMLT